MAYNSIIYIYIYMYIYILVFITECITYIYMYIYIYIYAYMSLLVRFVNTGFKFARFARGIQRMTLKSFFPKHC